MKRTDITSSIVSRYQERYREHGDDHKALGWPRLEEVAVRHQAMLDVMLYHSPKLTLLDFGCGLSHLYRYMLDTMPNAARPVYVGLDIVPEFIMTSRTKYPGVSYYYGDILNEAFASTLPDFDYVVCNGVFTEKAEVIFDDMWLYFHAVIGKLFDLARVGLAYNVMSPYRRRRRDLFQVPMGMMAQFVAEKLNAKRFAIRHDYGLPDYTVYVYKSAI